MRNVDRWKPTKVIHDAQGFHPSSDTHFLGVASRLVASCQVQHYRRVIQQHAAGRLLDLGCGYVPYYELYKDQVQEVVCVDWENSAHKNEFLDFLMDLNMPLSLESESFDTVLLTDVLEHIYKPAQLLSEVARVLRQGGHCIIGVPFLYWLHESPVDFHRYTEFALRKMCGDAGLEIESLTPYGGAPEIVVDIIGKCIATAKLDMICRMYTAWCDAALKLRPCRALSRKTAALFPLGYTLAARKVSADEGSRPLPSSFVHDPLLKPDDVSLSIPHWGHQNS
jgi:SAM-dependent methyltransferase